MALNETGRSDEKMGEDIPSELAEDEDIPPEMVQVKATMKEMNERMEQFIRYKRAQADANNIHDFCGPSTERQLCARVDAVLNRKRDSDSHYSVRGLLDRYVKILEAPSNDPARMEEVFVEPQQRERRKNKEDSSMNKIKQQQNGE